MTTIASRGYRSKIANTYPLLDNATLSLNKLIVFKGIMPVNLSNWVEADNSADKLVQFTNFNFIASTIGNKDRVIFNTFPSPDTVNAVGTGIAAWYAYVNNGVVSRYFFGDVTLNTGNGSLHISTGGSPDSLSIVSGNPIIIQNWSVQYVA